MIALSHQKQVPEASGAAPSIGSRPKHRELPLSIDDRCPMNRRQPLEVLGAAVRSIGSRPKCQRIKSSVALIAFSIPSAASEMFPASM